MKKILSVILVLTMVIPGLCVFASAESGSFLLVPSAPAAKPGDTVTFTVKGQGFSETNKTYMVELNSMDSNFELVGVGEWLLQGQELSDGFDELLCAAWTGATFVPNIDIFKFTVKIKEDAVICNGEIKITVIVGIGAGQSEYPASASLSVNNAVAKTTAGNTTVYAGFTEEFTVSLQNSDPVSAIMVEPVYDKTKFELVSGEFLIDGVMTDFSPELGDGVWAAQSNTNVNGNVFKFKLKALENVEAGETDVGCTVSVRNDKYTGDSGIYCISESATVTVADAQRGDFNNDDVVNEDDAIYLLKNTLRPDRYPITQSGDVNGDGAVDEEDAIYLLKHTLRQDRYPLK